MAAYGGECECCGENEPLLLDLDVVRNHADRAALRRAGFPPGPRVLCRSCKKGEALAGECPASASHGELRAQRERVRAMWRRQLEKNPRLELPAGMRL